MNRIYPESGKISQEWQSHGNDEGALRDDASPLARARSGTWRGEQMAYTLYARSRRQTCRRPSPDLGEKRPTVANRLTWGSPGSQPNQVRAGLRFGDKGTHTSRTMMSTELMELLDVVPREATREDYAEAIIEENALGKATASNRRHTNQRLGELFGLDPSLPLFRILRRLWSADTAGRPLLALLTALARDPLLRLTAPTILALSPGEELVRSVLLSNLARETEGRLKASIQDKVARNAGSTWTQSGHLEGRVRKVRTLVEPTPGSVTMALWLGQTQGLAGEMLLSSPWARVLDAAPSRLLDLALRAKQMGLVNARVGGGVIEIDTSSLDPAQGGA